jgi:hypothetical protein
MNKEWPPKTEGITNQHLKRFLLSLKFTTSEIIRMKTEDALDIVNKKAEELSKKINNGETLSKEERETKKQIRLFLESKKEELKKEESSLKNEKLGLDGEKELTDLEISAREGKSSEELKNEFIELKNQAEKDTKETVAELSKFEEEKRKELSRLESGETNKESESKVETNTEKKTETKEEDKEKTHKTKEDILNILKQKQEKAKSIMSSVENEEKDRIEKNIEKEREEFIKKYGDEVKGSFWKRKLNQFGSWAGFIKKDLYMQKGLDSKYNDSKNLLKDEQVLNEFVKQRVEEKSKGKNWSDEDLKKVEYRYRKLFNKEEKDISKSSLKKDGWTKKEIKALEERNKINKQTEKLLSGLSLEWVKKENELLRDAKKNSLEENKTETEKFLNLSSEWLGKQKAFRYTIGNKYFRFAALTGTIGLATGGFSTLFLMNRASRFVGGMIGGGVTKFLLDKFITRKKLLELDLESLYEDYREGKLTSSEYDTKREKIDLFLNGVDRTKQAYLILMSMIGGTVAGELHESYFGDNGHEAVDHDDKKHEDQKVDDNKQPEEVKNPEHKTEEVQKGEVPKDTTTEDQNTNSDQNNTTPEKTTPDNQPTNNTPEQSVKVEEDWVVGKGEGVTHPIMRQIESNESLAKSLGWDGDPDTLHKFAQHTAAKIAENEGYISDTGERWVYGVDKHDIAYELRLENDGSYGIHEIIDGKETDLTDLSSDQFETDVDKAGDGTVYEKTHQYGNYIKHSSNGEIYTEEPEVFIDENIPIEMPDPNSIHIPGEQTTIEMPDPRNIHVPGEQTTIEMPDPNSIPVPGEPQVNNTPNIPGAELRNGGGFQAPRTYDPSLMNPGPANGMQRLEDMVENKVRGLTGNGQVGNPYSNYETASSGPGFLEVLFRGLFGGN